MVHADFSPVAYVWSVYRAGISVPALPGVGRYNAVHGHLLRSSSQRRSLLFEYPAQSLYWVGVITAVLSLSRILCLVLYMCCVFAVVVLCSFFFFQAEVGIRVWSPSRGLGDVYMRLLL